MIPIIQSGNIKSHFNNFTNVTFQWITWSSDIVTRRLMNSLSIIVIALFIAQTRLHFNIRVLPYNYWTHAWNSYYVDWIIIKHFLYRDVQHDLHIAHFYWTRFEFSITWWAMHRGLNVCEWITCGRRHSRESDMLICSHSIHYNLVC